METSEELDKEVLSQDTKPKVKATPQASNKIAKPEIIGEAPKVAKTQVAKMVGRGRSVKLGMIPESQSKAKRVTASIRQIRQDARALNHRRTCMVKNEQEATSSLSPPSASNRFFTALSKILRRKH
ncbi:hypothetical protein CJP74_01230 [Psittacicella melopsittaci]|uniref:Uncharacterized protein n=1 Tax=Psittacicella melopsittaci TaxID=2028576 RepID=A0A3A1Y8W5_9GAMM|nr:hypothetical protein [Psittacicella melopsittaci]RIY33639.1 hypothetical protein CJP74_01230 [Psittacicella melopsittaci]